MVNAVKRRPLLLNRVTEVPDALQPATQVCEVVHAHEHGGRAAAVTAFGPRVQAVVTHGVHGLTAAEMDCMPRLSIVSPASVPGSRTSISPLPAPAGLR